MTDEKAMPDIDVKIGTPEEAAWTKQLKDVIETIRMSEMNIDIATLIKELAEKKLEEIKSA